MAVPRSVVLHSVGEQATSSATFDPERDRDTLTGWWLMAAAATLSVTAALFAAPPVTALLILAGWLR
jgi:hypothetical protein